MSRRHRCLWELTGEVIWISTMLSSTACGSCQKQQSDTMQCSAALEPVWPTPHDWGGDTHRLSMPDLQNMDALLR